MQGGIDLSYGILYAGVWASGIDFDAIFNDADLEVDWYGGIKPTWGPATFDFGVIYYTYPGATYTTIPPFGFDLNYVELKAGVSGTIHKDLALGGTIYWSPDYFAETGSVWTFEGTAGLHLPPGRRLHAEHHRRGRLSDQLGRLLRHLERLHDYWYYNAGLALAVEKLTFDFRYWGTSGASNALSDGLPASTATATRASSSAPRSSFLSKSLSSVERFGAGQIARPRLFWASAASAY